MHYIVSLLVATFCLALTKNVTIARAAAVASDLLQNVDAADSAALVAADVAAPAAAAAQPSAVNAAYLTDLLAADSNSAAAHENQSPRKARYLFYPYRYGGYYGGYGYGYGYPYYGYGGYYPYYGGYYG